MSPGDQKAKDKFLAAAPLIICGLSGLFIEMNDSADIRRMFEWLFVRGVAIGCLILGTIFLLQGLDSRE